MSFPIDPKYISSDMATDAEVASASTSDRDRANHTGTQTASTISDFTTAVQAVTIDASKIDGGTVSNAEFATLDGITTGVSIQSQLNGKEPSITAGTTSQYFRGDKSFQTLDKTAVGLSNVDNTADTAKTISGDVTGTLGSSTVAKLQTRTLSSTAPATNQVIKWDGSQWAPNYVVTWTSTTVSNGTLALTAASTRGQIFTGTVGGQVVSLPNATTLVIGDTFTFINGSDPLVIITDSAATYKATVFPTNTIQAILINNSTAAGVWSFTDQSLTTTSDFDLYDDFVSANVTNNQLGVLGWTVTTGTMAYQTSTGSSTGVLRVNTGAAASNVGAISLGTTAPVLINNSYTFCEARVSLPALGGGGANQLSFQLGLLNATANTAPGTNPLNAIGFTFDGSGGTPGPFTAFASSATLTSTSASAVTPVANTFYKLSFIVNTAGTSAYYYINNSFFATISTNLPTAIVMAPMVKVNSGNTNAAAKSLDVDYYRLSKIYTTPR